MKTKIINFEKCFSPALENNRGEYRSANFTTDNKNAAIKYAEKAAGMNTHNDLNKIIWPDLYLSGKS